jgi:hypothetical protein
LAITVDWHHIKRTMATVAPVTGIELQADHCKCIHTDPDSALGKAGFERASEWVLLFGGQGPAGMVAG